MRLFFLGVVVGVGLTVSAAVTADVVGLLPTVTSVDQANQFAPPPGTAVMSRLARGEHAFVAHLRMDPGAAIPEHRDESEEYIYVLSGSGTMMLNDERHQISAGTAVFMPSGAKVSFQNGDAPLEVIQVFAPPTSATKYEGWTPLTSDGDR